MRLLTHTLNCLAAILLVFFTATAHAADVVPAWVPVPKAASWELVKSQSFSYERLALPTAPMDPAKNWAPDQAENLQGKVWAGRFSAGKEGTVLKERREVEHALAQAGFEQIYACENAQCTKDNRGYMAINLDIVKGWERPFVRYDNKMDFYLASWKATLKVKGKEKGFGLLSMVGYTHGNKEPMVSFFVVETKPFEATAKLDASSIGQSLVKEGKVALPVTFDLDQSTVRPDGLRLLADAAEALRKNKNMKVRIDGHTDAQGNAEHNQKLSEARAESVKTILVTSGIAADRLSTQGLGSSQLAAKGATEADHAKNRRVELVVVK
ncbi:MAG: OmpA family protein [Thiomonas sp.]|uniref:OmpA family protein n=1 Tax=Thiomonas sp. TaxID=2047785 RepID=UPI002A35F30E|nr:OmpA family protein [Thiomonas sp.]MDY0330205.1 OmpA family protein [Thiomonas sp.]